MGRWTQYDEDEHRLPEGMKRVGYDADSGRYYFRDRNGVTYAGPEGAEFGQMTRVSDGDGPSARPTDEEAQDEDFREARTMGRADGYQPLAVDITDSDRPHKLIVNTAAYRTLFPFFLIIAVVLLLVYRLILAPATSAQRSDCPGKVAYWVQPGDSCWDVAKAHGFSLEVLTKNNPELDCERLMPGTTVCLPRSSTEGVERRGYKRDI